MGMIYFAAKVLERGRGGDCLCGINNIDKLVKLPVDNSGKKQEQSPGCLENFRNKITEHLCAGVLIMQMTTRGTRTCVG